MAQSTKNFLSDRKRSPTATGGSCIGVVKYKATGIQTIVVRGAAPEGYNPGLNVSSFVNDVTVEPGETNPDWLGLWIVNGRDAFERYESTAIDAALATAPNVTASRSDSMEDKKAFLAAELAEHVAGSEQAQADGREQGLAQGAGQPVSGAQRVAQAGCAVALRYLLLASLHRHGDQLEVQSRKQSGNPTEHNHAGRGIVGNRVAETNIPSGNTAADDLNCGEDEVNRPN